MNFLIVTIILIITPVIVYSTSEETNEQINYDNATKATYDANNHYTAQENIIDILEEREELCKERDNIILDNEIDLDDIYNNTEIPLSRLEDLYDVLIEIDEIDNEIFCLTSNNDYEFYKSLPIYKSIISDTKYNLSLITIINEIISSAEEFIDFASNQSHNLNLI